MQNEDIERLLQNIDDRLKRLETAILGDEASGIRGIGKKVSYIGLQVQKLKVERIVTYATVTTLLIIFEFWDSIKKLFQ
jgi:hypothetical protein